MATQDWKIHRHSCLCLVGAYPDDAYVVLSLSCVAKCVFTNLLQNVALCHNFAGIMAVRFILGMFESIIGPVFVILTSNWWTRPEQAFRSCVWLSGTPVRSNGGIEMLSSQGSNTFRSETSSVVFSATAWAPVSSGHSCW